MLPLFTSVAVGALMLSSARTHELNDNRATLVLREQRHVSVTMFITTSDALHRALAPRQSLSEFLLASAAMAPDVFARQLRTAQARWVSATSLATSNGARLTLSSWRWPDAARLQARLRERAMQLLVAPVEHTHEPPMEIQVQAIAATPITSVTMHFPPDFQRVLVVSYKPNQVWVEAGTPAPRIVF